MQNKRMMIGGVISSSSSVRRYDCVASALLLFVATSFFLSICCPGVVVVVVPITAFNLFSLDRYGGGGGGRRRGTTTATTTLSGGGGSFSTTATSRTVVSNWNLNLKQINRREDNTRSRSRSSISNNINPNVHHKRHDDVVVLGAVSLLAEEQEVPTAIAAVAKEREKKTKTNQKGKAHPPRRRGADADDDDVTTTPKQAQTHTHTHLDLDPHDAWIAHLDYTAFGKEVTLLGKHLLQQTGPADLEHLQKIVRWRNLAALLGLTTVWMTPNPLTAVALSTWSYASWTMIAHHTCHGGNDFKIKKEKENTDGNKRKKKKKSRFTSRGFGVGLQNRIIDWLDWMLPEAWNIEHNRLHHYRLNEPHGDPDLVQRNFQSIRDNTRLPYVVKYTITALLSTIWKWYYYAPNTYKELKVQEWKKTGKPLPPGFDPDEAVTILALLKPSNKQTLHQLFTLGDVLKDVLGPLLVGRYVLIPTVLWCLGRVLGGSSSVGVGQLWATNAMVNLLLGEVLTNMHSFATIVTNHAGPDMYTFEDAVIPKTGAFYVRQVVGSVNYHTGSDVNDFAHGFLNYQIEHHVWPHLSMLQYQRGAPQLKALCRKHGVPYVQENVFKRIKKTVDVAVGKTSMRIFPTQYEPANQKAGKQGVTWKSTHGAIDNDE